MKPEVNKLDPDNATHIEKVRNQLSEVSKSFSEQDTLVLNFSKKGSKENMMILAASTRDLVEIFAQAIIQTGDDPIAILKMMSTRVLILKLTQDETDDDEQQ